MNNEFSSDLNNQRGRSSGQNLMQAVEKVCDKCKLKKTNKKNMKTCLICFLNMRPVTIKY